MQVRGGGIRGLDLHLDRIADATRELFGVGVDRAFVRACLRRAIGGRDAPLSLRINVFSRALNRERPADAAPADVLVTAGPASAGNAAPLRVKSFAYARELPSVKHVGTFPLFHYRRLAQQAGCDDAVFVDAAGCISEGSIWNIGFHDGDAVVWPDAAQLAGVSMRLLQAGLAAAGVRSTTRPVARAEVGRYRFAFFTNTGTPVRPLASIDEFDFEADPALERMLAAAHDANPLQYP
jgi:branched-subunit amino acid aminotransferase/4-amino-4-deoxychorismate lyase